MRILTHDQLHRTAPAIFANEPDQAVSELFAESALSLRYGDDWQATSPVQPGDILEARRTEDANGSLWSVFNRTQENLFKGGIRGKSANGRRTRTRPINSVTEDVRLNRALWKLTEHFADLKGATVAA
jgi:hypothetical protein